MDNMCKDCLLEDANVKPCNTLGCKTRYHERCLIKSIQQKKIYLCPGCHDHIIEHKSYDNNGIILSYFNIIFGLFLTFTYPLLIFIDLYNANSELSCLPEPSFLQALMGLLGFILFCSIQILCFIMVPSSIYFEKSMDYLLPVDIPKKYIIFIYHILFMAIILTNYLINAILQYIGSLYLGKDYGIFSLIYGIYFISIFVISITIFIYIIKGIKNLHKFIINKNMTIQYGTNI